MKKRLQIYQAGAMEAASDLGAGWRKDITPFLEELGLEVLNPCEFEIHQLKGLQPNRLPEFYTDLHGKKVRPSHWHQLKSASEPHLYERFLRYMRRIIQYDCKLVVQSDIIIVLWDINAGKGAGTHAELTLAFLSNKPVYMMATCEVPAWAKACCTEIFLTWDALKDKLTEELS